MFTEANLLRRRHSGGQGRGKYPAFDALPVDAGGVSSTW